MNYAPIALFVHQRPEFTRQTIEALRANPEAIETELVIYADAIDNEASKTNVESTQQLIATTTGFKAVKVIHRQQHMGRARSILTGVSDMLREYKSVIVVEDDLLTAAGFLQFMNQALKIYTNERTVGTIHGNQQFLTSAQETPFFLRYFNSAGWATWNDRWQLFEHDAKKLLDVLQATEQISDFNLDNSFQFSQHLQTTIDNPQPNWETCWYASLFIERKLSLYPPQSLTTKISTIDSESNDDAAADQKSAPHLNHQQDNTTPDTVFISPTLSTVASELAIVESVDNRIALSDYLRSQTKNIHELSKNQRPTTSLIRRLGMFFHR
ncbi:MAG: hypothetical protein KUG79_05785 [Pseudomonadales bacterium]|nr:hypothetical protein [Pseudomonadales bacterium]